MPYSSKDDLPDSVKHVLPEHAQDIYQAAFNNAWQEYADASERQDGSDREETAHKVAWSAVKQKYDKTESGSWEEKA